jgi:hypothetical protein
MGIPFSGNAPTIRIFGWWERPFGQAAAHCTREQAQAMVQRKRARWRMSGFAVQLREPVGRRQQKFMKIIIHGTSCEMGPRVTEDACDEQAPGHKLAKAAAEAYLMIWAGSYCPLVLSGQP